MLLKSNHVQISKKETDRDSFFPIPVVFIIPKLCQEDRGVTPMMI